MPAKSAAQQMAMAIAEHAPSKLYKRNVGLKAIPKAKLSEFASTPRSSLFKKIGKHIAEGKSK